MSNYLAVLPLADVKAFLNLTDAEADTARDDWLQREVQTQLEVIEAYLDRPLVVTHVREEKDGTGTDSIDLDATPVQSVLHLHIDADRRFSAETRIHPSEYITSEDSVELLYEAIPRGRRNVRVDYIAGYAEIEIPFSRQRFDIRETAGGELLTVHLLSGKWKPKDLAESLESALNDVGDSERRVTFDWIHRRFVISQPEGGYLQVVTHVSGDFTSTTSATGLLGFAKDTELTDGQIVGSAVMLGIPAAIRTAALELVAMHYVKSAFGENHYGLRSYQLDDYRVQYETGAEDGSEDGAGIPEPIKNRLKPFKKWNLF